MPYRERHDTLINDSIYLSSIFFKILLLPLPLLLLLHLQCLLFHKTFISFLYILLHLLDLNPLSILYSCSISSSVFLFPFFSCFWFCLLLLVLNPYPTAFPYGNGMVLHFYQQQESSTNKTVHKVINKGLKTYV